MLKRSLLFCLFLNSCGEPDVVADKTDPSQKTDKLLILNGGAQSYTLLDQLHGQTNVTRNLAMSLDPNTDAQPCMMPNHMQRYGSFLYVTCSGNNIIHVVNASTLKTVLAIDLLGNYNPMSTLFVDEDLAYSSGFYDKLIPFNPRTDLKMEQPRLRSAIDLSELPLERDANTVTHPAPGGLAKMGDTGFLALSNLTVQGVAGGPGYVLSFDLKMGTLKKLIKTRGRNTTQVYAGVSKETQNWLYIVNTGTYKIGEGSVDVYDVLKDTIIQNITFPDAAPGHLVFASDGTAYVTNTKNASVLSFNASTFATNASIDLKDQRCDSVGDSKRAFISSLSVENEFLFATEFNSHCLLIIERKSGIVMRKHQTGNGPVAMMAF